MKKIRYFTTFFLFFHLVNAEIDCIINNLKLCAPIKCFGEMFETSFMSDEKSVQLVDHIGSDLFFTKENR